ncbi:MAG TPA: ABC transporter ATP-binding protein [Rhodopila sp.]|uniref:ABC transporter ATP-binding protein n=1 Tax=Rhodopila sp. TaxID=2480087 RepID=UPI002B5CAF28|nr:ABC transporter ATP-binding protein [Rhodopila sp.]HVY17705.1 ABC transporter ATP-binding protein [Rhodopila sp.]
MHTEPAAVRLTDLTKLYGPAVAVDKLSLSIEPGELIALLGPSGCGKTTSLRMIAGLIEPSHGDIFVNGRSITNVPVHRRNIGMLFQSYALFPHLSVLENVMFGLEMRGIRKRDAGDRAREALELVQLSGHQEKLPARLSGGQQQRVALARALVIEPAMLLLDEPLGALDKNLREDMQVELRLLQRRLGITTIMVTHDQDEAMTLSDRIVVMNKGKLEQVGPPAEVYQRPATRFVAGFLGVSNFFSGRIAGRSGGAVRVACSEGLDLTVPAEAASGDRVTVALRPEAIRVSVPNGAATPNQVVATLEQVLYRGFMVHYHMRLPNGTPLVAFEQSPTTTEIAPGTPVLAAWDEASNRVVADEAT